MNKDVPSDDYSHEFSQFHDRLPVTNFNNVLCDHEQDPKWQEPKAETITINKTTQLPKNGQHLYKQHLT